MAGQDATGISIQGVTLSYGDVVALDDVTLDVNPGEFVTLLGPSGSGKTTLLMALAGFVMPEHGAIRFGDQEMTRIPPHRRRAGVVFQNYALFPHMDVFANIAYALRIAGRPRAEIRRRVAEALELVQLSGLESRHINELSGGQQQRVALARAIIFHPRVLLMDEPLSALDKNLREQMQIEIRHLHDKLGTTTVSVTHDQREALTMSDRIAVMRRGRILQTGTPKEVYERPATRFVAQFLGGAAFIRVLHDGDGWYLGDRKLHCTVSRDTVGKLLMLRPEKLEVLVGDPSDEWNVLEAVVSEVIYQGDSTLATCTLEDGQPLGVRLPTLARTTMPTPGEKIRLGLAPEDTVLVSDDPVLGP